MSDCAGAVDCAATGGSDADGPAEADAGAAGFGAGGVDAEVSTPALPAWSS